MACLKPITTKKCSAYEHIIELREKFMQMKKIVLNIDAGEEQMAEQEKTSDVVTLQKLGEELKTKTLLENIQEEPFKTEKEEKLFDIEALQELGEDLKTKTLSKNKHEEPFTREQEENASYVETQEKLGADFKKKTLSEDIQSLQKLCGEIEMIFGQMKLQNKGYVFYILDLSPSQATSSFTVALQNRINVRLLKHADDIKDIDKRSRVLVTCSLTSRFDCNLEIMKEINPKYHNKIVLVLLHCMHKNNLPSDSRIPEVKKIYPDLNEVVEMAFHKNIYRCSMNKKALKVLRKYEYLG